MSGAPFLARYGGRCLVCDGQISPGDMVVYDDDDALVHQGCENYRPPRERQAPVCSTCWLTKPCGCDDEAIA